MPRLDIEYDDRPILFLLRNLRQAGRDLTPAMRSIAAALQDSVEEAFATQSSPDGVPWAPLSDVTTDARAKRGKWPGPLLRVTGNLLDSITSDSDATSAVVGTNAPYATTHHFGDRRGEFGTDSRGRPLPWGDIPARPFLGLSTEEREHIPDIRARHFSDAADSAR